MKLVLTLLALGMGGCVVEQAPADDDGAEAATTEEMVGEPATRCGTHGDCPSGTFCRFEPGSCGASEGTCTSTAVPREVLESCTVAVCGCDGRDYTTACDAWMDGVSVLHEGPCTTQTDPPQAPPSCGGVTCAPGQFCSYVDGACGGSGTCTDMIGSCTSAANPVCGCDGVTYSSRCSAMQAGISVQHEGGC